MRVGIVTFHWAVNYGAVLQAYALKTRIQSLGHQTSVINFAPRELKAQYSINPLAFGLAPKRVVERLAYLAVGGYIRTAKFSSFCRRFLNLTQPVDGLGEIAKQFDAVVVGSDQVWNPEIVGRYLNEYLLTSVECRRVAYAASLGSSTLPEPAVEVLGRAIGEFHRVSVREPESPVLLGESAARDIEVTLDPVFLLDEGQWSCPPFTARQVRARGQYLLLYMLGFDAQLAAAAQRVAERLAVPVYCLHVPYFSPRRLHLGQRNLFDVGPREFPMLFKNARFVVTDSFHGTAFAIIFRRPFAVKPPCKRGERIVNILRITSTEDHLLPEGPLDVHRVDRLIECAHDFGAGGERSLQEAIDRSVSFLRHALND